MDGERGVDDRTTLKSKIENAGDGEREAEGGGEDSESQIEYAGIEIVVRVEWRRERVIEITN